MRLFVAVDLDDEARRAIGAEERRMAKALDDNARSLRWVAPDHLHVTLAFLGEVEEATAEAVAAAMTPDFAAAPFLLSFRHIGVFPPRGAPRALWVGIAEGASELAGLERQVVGRLRALRVVDDSRPFRAHLTLGRWRASRASDRARALALDRGSLIASAGVDHVTLYRSVLSVAGPSYTALVRATLRS